MAQALEPLTVPRPVPRSSPAPQPRVSQPDDTEQIGLIRTHLQQEAKAFSRGDYGDPARIHGDSMPGLKGLQDGYERIEVRCRGRPEGATLTYATAEPALVDALHNWFAARLSDHGDHAETGH